MITRICSKCKEEKPLTKEFFQFRTDTQKYMAQCKKCRAQYRKKHYESNKEQVLLDSKEYYRTHKDQKRKTANIYREAHKEQLKLADKEYRKNNKDKIKQKNAQKYQANRDQILEDAKVYRSLNKEKLSLQSKKRYKKNRSKILDRRRKWRQDNRVWIREQNRTYRKNNRERYLEYHRNYQKQKRESDLAFRIHQSVSRSVRGFLRSKNLSKGGRAFFEHVPYSEEEMLVHFQSQYEFWMHDNNNGPYRKDLWDDNDPSTWTWQIDHIIPHSEFHYTSMEDEEFKKCWALSNLRPLSANISKTKSIRGRKKTSS